MIRHSNQRNWDDDDEDEDRYDDSVGYGDDSDEDEEYEEFLEREFGSGQGGSRLSRLQYATVIVLLAVFIVPPLLYLYAALTQ